MTLQVYITVAVLAYFLGAVPFGYIYSRIRGVDIRTLGSGNIGATNVSRQFGFWGGFVPIFILDAVKGATPVLLVRLIGVRFQFDLDLAMLIVGLAAILGHMFSIYLKFKGGKGVATAAGVFFVIAPIPALIALSAFLVLYIISRIVALSSIVAAIVLPVSLAILSPDRKVLILVSVFIGILIIFAHHTNIKKLLKRNTQNTSKHE